MDKDDREKIDETKDRWLKLIADLNEIIAGYGLEANNSKELESRRRAKADRGILKRIVDLYKIFLEQYDQINKQANTIIKIRQEIASLKSEINSLKK